MRVCILLVIVAAAFAQENQATQETQETRKLFYNTPAPTGTQGNPQAGVQGAGSGNGLWILIQVIFAIVYYKNAVAPVLERGTPKFEHGNFEDDDFNQNICGCFENKCVCIHGLCCPTVRMAHTNAVSGVLAYWSSIAAFCCAGCLCGPCGQGCLMVYWRSKLKEVMGIDQHFLNDCIVTCCCPYLAICQQAQAVDEALGYEVDGFCGDLEFNGGALDNADSE